MTDTRWDVREHNRIAWDALAEQGNEWTVPVSPEAIEEARHGRWEIVLTPTKPVPRAWLEVEGRQVLCLASGGGQQAPILAAAGASVTVLDNSPKQLECDGRAARPPNYDSLG
jgi:2-polyprenyl-3-methyl-5-hydroxy-6-metoxy-1,4-benzoquinol methylase